MAPMPLLACLSFLMTFTVVKSASTSEAMCLKVPSRSGSSSYDYRSDPSYLKDCRKARYESIGYMDPRFSDEFHDHYFDPHKHTWNNYNEDIKRAINRADQATEALERRYESHLYPEWFRYLSQAEIIALKERMAMLWKTALTSEGTEMVMARIRNQLSLRDADLVMFNPFMSDIVKQIVKRTEDEYEDPDVDKIAMEAMKVGGVSRAKVDAFTKKVLRTDGMRGFDYRDIAAQVNYRMSRQVLPRMNNHTSRKERSQMTNKYRKDQMDKLMRKDHLTQQDFQFFEQLNIGRLEERPQSLEDMDEMRKIIKSEGFGRQSREEQRYRKEREKALAGGTSDTLATKERDDSVNRDHLALTYDDLARSLGISRELIQRQSVEDLNRELRLKRGEEYLDEIREKRRNRRDRNIAIARERRMG